MNKLLNISKRLASFVFHNLALYAHLLLLWAFALGVVQEFHFWAVCQLLAAYFLVGIGGYFFNDLFDQKADKLAQKFNATEVLGNTWLSLLILASWTTGFLLVHYLSEPASWILLVQFAVLVLYSVPPIRLKEKGLAGIVADALYAHVVPALLMIFILQEYSAVPWLPATAFLVFCLFLGARDILQHQRDDLENDRMAGVATFTVKREILAEKARMALNFLTSAALVSFLFLCGLHSANLYLHLLTGLVTIMLAVNIVLKHFTGTLKTLQHAPVKQFLIGSTIVLAILCVQSKSYAFLLLLPNLYFYRFLKNVASRATVEMLMLAKTAVLKIVSLIVNYSLYYLFLAFGRNLKTNPLYTRKGMQPPRPTFPTKNALPVSHLIGEKNVHALWIGSELTPIELLTIHSFIAHGYDFHLWTYGEIATPLPEATILRDANEIIPQSKVFSYKFSSQYGIGKGSVAGFSDVFRYKLLHDHGGWWVDMDVVCLKPFDVASAYFFRAHHHLPLVGNVMKAPKGSPMMWECYEEAISSIDENNRDWHKPIEILVGGVQRHQLENCIYGGISNTDEWHKVKPLVMHRIAPDPDWRFIHWCNEAWKNDYLKKTELKYRSTLGEMLSTYGLLPELSDEEKSENDRKIDRKQKMGRLLDWISA